MTLYAHVSIRMRAFQFVFICTDIAFHLHKRHGLTCRSLHVCHTFVLMHQSTLFTSAHNPLGLQTAISHSRCITHQHDAFVLPGMRCLHFLTLFLLTCCHAWPIPYASTQGHPRGNDGVRSQMVVLPRSFSHPRSWDLHHVHKQMAATWRCRFNQHRENVDNARAGARRRESMPTCAGKHNAPLAYVKRPNTLLNASWMPARHTLSGSSPIGGHTLHPHLHCCHIAEYKSLSHVTCRWHVCHLTPVSALNSFLWRMRAHTFKICAVTHHHLHAQSVGTQTVCLSWQHTSSNKI